MHVSPPWRSTPRLVRTRRIAAIGMPAALSLFLAGVIAPAGASASVTPSATQPVSVTPVPPAQVEEVLSKVPLKNLPTARLSEVLSRLPGLSDLPKTTVQEALTKTIESLETKEGTLGQFGGSPELVSTLEGELNKLLSSLELSSLLHGNTLSSVLPEALGSVDDRQLLGELLSSAGDPEQLIEQVLAAPAPEKLEQLLGTTLAGQPFTSGTVGELATQTGMTPEALASDFGTTSSQLPASAMALTTPLANGKTLSVLDAAEGIDLGTLETNHEQTSEGAAGGSGGAGGPGGGSGGAGATGGTTMLVTAPSAQSAAVPGSSAKAKLAGIKILSRKVRGNAVTVVVQVPAAGGLAVTGKGLKSHSEQADRAERVTLRTVLTKAGLASLRRHRRVKVELDVSFKPVSGASSAAKTTVTFA